MFLEDRNKRIEIERLARSPDLTLLDFLWGYLKSKVYVTKPNNIQNLKQHTIAAKIFFTKIAYVQVRNFIQVKVSTLYIIL
jgi:selenophosphate synthetase-related protein